MTTKELIQAEIEQVSEEDLAELYSLVKNFALGKQGAKPSLMAKLKGIQIAAPADFSANFELYSSGEKRVESKSLR